MPNIVVGTAGHVDHGKTVLVKALTGRDTDRLPEEKRRGISIDLGFAEFTLPGGIRVGLVDVPGHERFIRNMVAGVSGVDLVLLVIAADEGVMPQTTEHLHILELLGVRKGLVVITKIDLVDKEWLELVKEEVAEALRGTFLEGAPLVCTSARQGWGIEELKEAIGVVAGEMTARDAGTFARLPVDRVFVVPGFGTVVTGTLVGGTIEVEDRLDLLPPGLEVRVRQVQVYGEKVQRAQAGQRVALNLAGVVKDEVERGHVLVEPGFLRPTRSFAARLKLLATAGTALANGKRVRLHTGTSEVIGRVLLLEGDRLSPGDTAYIYFKAEKPLVVARGDRFIIRAYSPMFTIGGGVILDAAYRFRRLDPRGLEELAVIESGDLARMVPNLLERRGTGVPTVQDLARMTQKPVEEIRELVEDLKSRGQLVSLGEGDFLMAGKVYEKLKARVITFLEKYHRDYPLRQGCPREELRHQGMKTADPKVFSSLLRLLADEKIVSLRGDVVARHGFQVGLSDDQERAARQVLDSYSVGGLSPPEVDGVLRSLGLAEKESDEILRYLVGSGQLVKVSEGLYLHRDWLDEARRRVTTFLAGGRGATVSELRDVLATTRKFAVPLLEYFDQIRLTQRFGDKRRLRG